MITAKVIEHSSYKDTELISIETYAPKFLDAEIEKHRMISSNSSSDRAIPFSKMRDKTPYIPIDLRYNERGMQGSEVLSREDYRYTVDTLKALYLATTKHLETLEIAVNLHKQHLNRYLLGFSMQKKIMTATREEWSYFFGLRLHEDADPSVQILAEEIYNAIHLSSSRSIPDGVWHLPYVTDSERSIYEPLTLCKVSASRCARTSYDNFDGTKASVDKDLELFNKLVGSNPKHMSPLDHQGLPALSPKDTGVTHIFLDDSIGSGNFRNWIQFRHYYLQTEGKE